MRAAPDPLALFFTALTFFSAGCYDASGTGAPVEEGGERVSDPVPPRRSGLPPAATESPPGPGLPPPAPAPQPPGAALQASADAGVDAGVTDVAPVSPDAAALDVKLATHSSPDVGCCDRAPAGPATPPVVKVLYAKEIKADEVDAGTIYAKTVQAERVVATIHEDPGESRWNDANTAPVVTGGRVNADVIYVKELHARTVRARVIYAKEVKASP